MITKNHHFLTIIIQNFIFIKKKTETFMTLLVLVIPRMTFLHKKYIYSHDADKNN